MSRIATIQSEVCAHYGISRADMLGYNRASYCAKPRFVAMAIVQDLIPDQSYPMIGRHFRRDHTTVINAVRRVDESRQDAAYDDFYHKLRSRIEARISPTFRTTRKGAVQ